MASEDSVENLLLRYAPVLAIPVDGVGEPDEFHDAFESPLSTLIHKVDHGRKDLVVDYARRKTHVVTKEWNDSIPKDLAIPDSEHKHALIPRLGTNDACTALH